MGTTLTLIKVSNDKLECLSVGDSPVYLIKSNSCEVFNRLDQLEKKSPIITNCLGANTSSKELKVHYNTSSLLNIDGVIICSDGVSNKLNEQEILKLFNNNTKDLAHALVTKAIEKGSEDNASVALIKF